MTCVYPPPPYHYPLPISQQLCRKRPRELLPEDEQPFQRRRIAETHILGASNGDEDVAMLEPDAATDIIMSEVEADEDEYVLAHIPGQVPGLVRLGGSIPNKVPAAVVPTLISSQFTLFISYQW